MEIIVCTFYWTIQCLKLLAREKNNYFENMVRLSFSWQYYISSDMAQG